MYSDFQRTILPNGLVVLAVPMDNIPSVTVLAMLASGSRYEIKKQNGISHFLEHMAFKGTKKRPSAFAISSVIDGIGGEFNAFTGKDHTGYYIKASVRHLALITDVLADMLQNPLFDPAEIEKEKGVITEEINMYEDIPARKVGDLFETLLYGDTALGRDVAGTKEKVASFTRADFLNYVSRFYHPGAAVVAVAGGIEGNENAVINAIGEAFSGWQGKSGAGFEKAVDNQNKPALSVSHKKSEQAHLCLGFRGLPLDHPDHYVLSVLATILGGGMSSRLFIEVREKRGLCYYIRTASESFQDTGYIVTQAGVDLRRADEAVKVILTQHENMTSGQNGIADEELTRAKEFLKGRFILDLEDSRAVAGLYASDEILERKLHPPKEIIAEIEKVKLGDVQRLAKNIFKKETLNLAVIGPFADQSKFEKAIA